MGIRRSYRRGHSSVLLSFAVGRTDINMPDNHSINKPSENVEIPIAFQFGSQFEKKYLNPYFFVFFFEPVEDFLSLVILSLSLLLEFSPSSSPPPLGVVSPKSSHP